MYAVDFQCSEMLNEGVGFLLTLHLHPWLARTHALPHKAFLSGTKSVYCGQGGHSFQTHGGDLTPHIQVIGKLLTH